MKKQPKKMKRTRRSGWPKLSPKSTLARKLIRLDSGPTKSPLAKLGRVAGIAVAGAALLFGCYMVGVKASKPYVISYRESKDIVSIKREISEAEAENRALKGQIGYLKTDRGKVAEARKLGFVKPGEISLVVGKSEDDQSSSDHPQEHKGLWSNVRKHASSTLHKVKSLL